MTDLSAGPDTSGRYPDPEAIRQKRIAELEQEISLRRSMVFPTTTMQRRSEDLLAHLEAELSRLRNEQPKGSVPWCEHSNCPLHECEICSASPSPSPEPQDVRGKIAQLLLQASAKCSPWLVGPVQWHELDVHNRTLYLTQADELLSAFPALAQSDAQPVGWQEALKQMWFKDSWFELEGGARLNFEGKTLTQIWQRLLEGFFQSDYYRSLYTAPPRPDASGLIEAAEWHEEQAKHFEGRHNSSTVVRAGLREDYTAALRFHKAAALHFRSRTADRSAPRSDEGGGVK